MRLIMEQPDLVEKVLQAVAVVAVGTVAICYVCWKLTNPKD